jgi:hypothetical protein
MRSSVVNLENRRGLSQFINYMARPPIAEARLQRIDAVDVEASNADTIQKVDFQLTP